MGLRTNAKNRHAAEQSTLQVAAAVGGIRVALPCSPSAIKRPPGTLLPCRPSPSCVRQLCPTSGEDASDNTKHDQSRLAIHPPHTTHFVRQNETEDKGRPRSNQLQQLAARVHRHVLLTMYNRPGALPPSLASPYFHPWRFPFYSSC